MQQPCPAAGTRLRQRAGSACVAQEGKLTLVLGTVHRRMRGRVDHDVRRQPCNELNQGAGIAEVGRLAGCAVGQTSVARGAGDLAELRKAALQFGADLPGRAQQEDAHG